MCSFTSLSLATAAVNFTSTKAIMAFTFTVFTEPPHHQSQRQTPPNLQRNSNFFSKQGTLHTNPKLHSIRSFVEGSLVRLLRLLIPSPLMCSRCERSLSTLNAKRIMQLRGYGCLGYGAITAYPGFGEVQKGSTLNVSSRSKRRFHI